MMVHYLIRRRPKALYTDVLTAGSYWKPAGATSCFIQVQTNKRASQGKGYQADGAQDVQGTGTDLLELTWLAEKVRPDLRKDLLDFLHQPMTGWLSCARPQGCRNYERKHFLCCRIVVLENSYETFKAQAECCPPGETSQHPG